MSLKLVDFRKENHGAQEREAVSPVISSICREVRANTQPLISNGNFGEGPHDPLDYSRDEIARAAIAIGDYCESLISLASVRDDEAIAAIFRRMVARMQVVAWSLELIVAGLEGRA